MASYEDDEWNEAPATNQGWAAQAPKSNNDEWNDRPSGGGFVSRGGYRGNSDGGGRGGGGFRGNRDGNDGGGRGGFRSGFGQQDSENGGGRNGAYTRSDGDSGFPRGFRNNDENGGSGNRGRGGREGFGGRRDDDGENNEESRGFGRGGFSNNRGGRGGFNQRDNDEDGEERGSGRGGYGGNRGYRGGGRGGRFGGDDNGGDDDGREERGFGGNRGYRGGGRGGRFGGDDDGEERGFGGNRGRGGRGGRFGGDDNGGFKKSYGGDDEPEGGGGFRGGRGGIEGDDEKPKEHYQPMDTDENDIYSQGISSGINFDKYDNIEVKVTGEDAPPGITTFENSGLRPILLDNVRKCQYEKPTPVQKAAIPIVMLNRDIMVCAQTGSGKTAAFLLPILHNLLHQLEPAEVSPEGAAEPQCVILTPTRELTIQIYDEARKFSKDSLIKCEKLYGGTSTNFQRSRIMNGVHLLVATPGRLHDMVDKGKLSFSKVRYAVLDEADRMLDDGFREAIEKMMHHPTMNPPGERTTLMFSATFPQDVQTLAGKYLQNYLFLTVGMVGGACADVTQTFYQVDKFDKRKKLLEILAEHNVSKTIVFVETKKTTDFIASLLCESQLPATSIHGDRLQRERESALSDFRRGTMRVLVATAVAGRGLDIKGVDHVINFDLPKRIDDYVHRIGRTGRVGNLGLATSFYDSQFDRDLAPDLLKILVQAEQNIPEWLQQDAGAGGVSSYQRSGFGGKDIRSFDKRGGGREDNFSSAPTPVEAEEEW